MIATGPIWDEGGWPGRPPLHGPHRASVCVVGLGGSGLACIDELAGRGCSVIGLDRAEVAAGAAGRNGGFLMPGLAAFYHQVRNRLGRERALSYYRRTAEELERMAADSPDLVRRTGVLRIAVDELERADCDTQYQAMREDGLPIERYRGAEGEGLLFPADGVFHPTLRHRALARRAEGRGARLFERSRVHRVTPGRVETEAGSVECDQVVVALDGLLGSVLPSLAGRVRDVRLQMLATAPTTEVRLTRPIYARYGYDYWNQLPDGRVVLGGGRDVGGDAEYTAAAVPTAIVQEALTELLRGRVRVAAPVTHRWAAIVGYTDTGEPICEEVLPGVWAIGGFNGTGNLIGAVLGRDVARRVSARR